MEKIKTELKNLCLEIIQSNDNKHSQWLDKTAKLYEKLLVLEYLDLRDENLNRINESVKNQLDELLNQTKSTLKPQPSAPKSAPQNQQTEMPLGNEVKILPHPEGPPPNVKQKDIEETIQEIEKETIKTTAPKAPEKIETPKAVAPTAPAKVEAKKMSIAEMAVSNGSNASLNDRLSNKSLKFGLNDRIAFVKHLFNGSQEDFNRVVSQLNTFDAVDEAEQFIIHIVKPEYSWAAKEEYEERFMNLVRSKF